MKNSSNVYQPKVASRANAVQLWSQPGAQAATITDNRPTATRQRKIQEAATQQRTAQLKLGATPIAAVTASQKRSIVVQRVIVKGKTHRSKNLGLKSTAWYKDELSDQKKAFAEALHAEEKKYTKAEAIAEIDRRIANGDPTPTYIKSQTKLLKEQRARRVRDYVNANAPKSTDPAYQLGRILSRAGKRAYGRHLKKYQRNSLYEAGIKKVRQVKPGRFKNQKPILSDRSTWQQMVALINSLPQSYDFNIGGSKVTLDSLDLKSNDERSQARIPTAPRLPQLFIDQPGGKNSYWKMSDSGNSTLVTSREHQQLVHLEVERKKEAAFTTYMKNTLIQNGGMTTKEAFGDEGNLAYQEYKGALSPTAAMQSMQTASAHQVLEHALAQASADANLGTQVGTRPLTTSRKIKKALDNFMKKQTEVNYKLLVKEIYRLIRANTRMDQDSDSETDSDTDY